MDVQKLLRYCVEKLVENTEKVSISQTSTPEKTIYEIRVAAQDLAKVIGKEGKTYKALRALMNIPQPNNQYDLVLDSLAE